MRTKIEAKSKYVPRRMALLDEAAHALIEKLGISKASEFWSSLSYGSGDYLKVKKELFSQDTVASLFKKVKKFQA